MKRIFLLLLSLVALTCYSYSDENKQEKELTLITGDSREVVREKWGSPAQIDRLLKDGIPKEVWIYTCQYIEPFGGCTNWYYDLPCYYLFFENKELQSWQDLG